MEVEREQQKVTLGDSLWARFFMSSAPLSVFEWNYFQKNGVRRFSSPEQRSLPWIIIQGTDVVHNDTSLEARREASREDGTYGFRSGRRTTSTLNVKSATWYSVLSLLMLHAGSNHFTFSHPTATRPTQVHLSREKRLNKSIIWVRYTT